MNASRGLLILALISLTLIGRAVRQGLRSPRAPDRVAARASRVNTVADLTNIPEPLAGEALLPYIWKLHDLYEVGSGGQLHVREVKPATVRIGQPLLFKSRALHQMVQLARRLDFSGEREHFTTAAGQLELPHAFIGANFWRVSDDGHAWSRAVAFAVEPGELDLDAELSLAPNGEYLLSASGPARGFVLELSRDRDFPPGATRALWVAASQPRFKPVLMTGFARARAVGAAGELGPVSAAVALTSP